MVTLRQLRYFEALARHGHFGRAAAECAVTQPALSQQIRELEAFLETPLVERQPSGLRLTEAGARFAEGARTVLGDVGALVESVRHRGPGLAGTLRLGIIPSVAPYLLPALLPQVHRRYPALDLDVREALTQALTEDLAGGRLDAVVLALPVEAAGLEVLPLFDDRFLLAAPRAQVPAGRGEAHLADLAGERLLLLEEGHCLREQTLTYCRPAGPEVRNALGATSLATIVQMVANGYGVTLLPEMAVRSEIASDPRIAILPFAAPQPGRTVALAWRKSARRDRDFRLLAQMIGEVCTSGEGQPQGDLKATPAA